MRSKKWWAVPPIAVTILLASGPTMAHAARPIVDQASKAQTLIGATADLAATAKHRCKLGPSSMAAGECPRRGPVSAEAIAAARRVQKTSTGQAAKIQAEPDGMVAVSTPPLIPTWCDLEQEATNLRMNDCFIQTSYVVFYRVPNGSMTGIATVTYFEWATLNPDSRSWDHHLAMYVSDAFDDALNSTFIATPWCNAACGVANPTTPTRLTTRVNQWYKGKWTLSSPGTATVYPEQNTDLYFTSTVTPDRQIYDFTPPMGYARCDSSSLIADTPNGGCSYYKVAPRHELSPHDWRYGRHAAFVATAQVELPDGWGLPRYPPLTRMYDPVLEANNHATSCAGFLPTGPMDSCDVYPFAGTYQGAAIIGKSRTAVGHVPVDQRAAGNAAFATFVSSNRILDGDTFSVNAGVLSVDPRTRHTPNTNLPDYSKD
ncbi:hypothetical protein ABNF97_33305 [Plantactinospora sp. B6F1]|uniref:hypothetical protein n=1 Tax=Plantactinospora sp. B6F1 TaxID=3158971 RepID=UPI0032D8E6BF